MESHSNDTGPKQKDKNTIKQKPEPNSPGSDSRNSKCSAETNISTHDNKNDTPKSFWERWIAEPPTQQAMTYFTAFIVMFTLILMICSICQTNHMKSAINQANDTFKYNVWKDSVNSEEQRKMNNSALALSKTISDRQEYFAKVETRAYISITSITISKPQPDSITHVNAIYMNVGKTPANNCRSYFKPMLVNYDMTREEIKSKIIEPKVGFTCGVNMQVPIHTMRNFNLTEFSCDSIKNGSLKLYVFGTIFYNDVFFKPHYTNFCGLLNENTIDVTRINIFSDAN